MIVWRIGVRLFKILRLISHFTPNNNVEKMTSAAAPSPDGHQLSVEAGDPSGSSSDSESETDMDSKDDDLEYEEIEDEIEAQEEIEEEVEEEEIEEEEVEEEVNEGESSDSLIDGNPNDISQDMASKVQEEDLRPGSSDRKKSVSNLQSDTLAVEGGSVNPKFSSPSEARQKRESHVDVDDLQYKSYGFPESSGHKKDLVALLERVTPMDDRTRDDINFSLCTSGNFSSETPKALHVFGNEIDAAIREEFCNATYVVSRETEVKKVVPLPQSTGDIEQGPTRLVVPQITLRSLSPVAELDDRKKRPAAICDFFGKGWCIKGSSCRFLHIKDHVNSTSQKLEGDIADLAEKSALQASGGDRGENPMWPNLAEENHKILSLRRDELSHSNSRETSQSHVNKANGRPTSSSKHVGRENVKQNWPSEDIPIHRDSYFPEHRSLVRNSFTPSDAYTSLSTSGIVSSQSISGLTMPSFCFGSLDNDPLSAQKLPDCVREYCASGSASFLRSSSPFSGSESGNLSLINGYADPLRGRRTKISANDWEPSVPFRPSYLITQSLLSSGSMYDPIRDSIDQPNLGDGFSKFSSIGDTTVTHSRLSLDCDFILKRTLGSEGGLNKQSIVDHHKFDNKNFEGKTLFTSGGEKVRTDDMLKIMSTLSEEDKLPSPLHFKDIAKESKPCFDYDNRSQEDGPRPKKQLKVDRSNNDMDIDLKTGEDQKDSKALRYFRGTLVDFVKELVKPKWREGHLSKDAHKIIVKRAVEKVLSTLQLHQTPSTTESVKQYLTTSEPKISKLVEGYVVKYAKY